MPRRDALREPGPTSSTSTMAGSQARCEGHGPRSGWGRSRGRVVHTFATTRWTGIRLPATGLPARRGPAGCHLGRRGAPERHGPDGGVEVGVRQVEVAASGLGLGLERLVDHLGQQPRLGLDLAQPVPGLVAEVARRSPAASDARTMIAATGLLQVMARIWPARAFPPGPHWPGVQRQTSGPPTLTTHPPRAAATSDANLRPDPRSMAKCQHLQCLVIKGIYGILFEIGHGQRRKVLGRRTP